MAEDRRDGNLVAFLAGFALGALLVGGTTGGFLYFQHERMRAEAMRAERDAALAALIAVEQEALARKAGEEAERKVKAAREALGRLKGK